MRESHSNAYAAAGVDITAGYRAVELMKEHIARTMIPGAGAVGGFGAIFELDLAGIEKPCLVSGTDGVGTKIRLAQLLGIVDTVGIDCVAMCVNDIVCCGAKPLVFLDYIAIGKNDPEIVAQIVAGVAEGCVRAGCALAGGETAEHPGLMMPEDWDIAGFTVGVVDKKDILDGSDVKEGDVLIGLLSTGLHSNGFSLVRKVFDVENTDLDVILEETGTTLGEELLRPTAIYVKPVLAAVAAGGVHAAAHITGGGLVENIPRAVPNGLEPELDWSAWEVPGIFRLIQKKGKVSDDDMMNTFNMGIGMVLVCEEGSQDRILSVLSESGAPAKVIGRVVRGEGGAL